MIKNLAHILRLMVGVLFIFSGLVKAVDPMGTAFKMEEYFTVFDEYLPALGSLWDLMIDWSLGFSMFMVILEVVLGIAFLFGNWFSLTSGLLIAMLLFFTVLTGFTLVTGKVTDCGCFGDFIKLKPIETFGKDIILSLMILFVLIFRKRLTAFTGSEYARFVLYAVIGFFFVTLLRKFGMQGNINTVLVGLFSAIIYGYYQYRGLRGIATWLPFLAGSVLAAWFTFRNTTNLPWVNFRHYKIGQDLRKCTNEEGLDAGETIKTYTLKNKLNGSTKTATDKEYMSQKLYNEWEVLPGQTTEQVIREAQEPPCKDFHVYSKDGEELRDSLLNYKGYSLWVTSYKLETANKEGFTRINNLIKEVQSPATLVLGLSNADVEKANGHTGGLYGFNNLDATPIKTMMRSNPGLLLIRDGHIKGLFHHNHLPSAEELKNLMQ